MEVTGQGGLIAPTQGEQLAYADNAIGSIYDNVSFKGAGQDISSATSYIPHSQALKTRLQKPGAWIKSIGKSAHFMESNFQKRVNQVNTGRDPHFDDVIKISVGNATHRGTATIDIATDGKANGAQTGLVASIVVQGDILVVDGVEYRILTAPTGDVANDAPADTGARVGAIAVAIPATTDAYILRKKARPANNRNKLLALWQPPIGIMDHDEVLGAGDW